MVGVCKYTIIARMEKVFFDELRSRIDDIQSQLDSIRKYLDSALEDYSADVNADADADADIDADAEPSTLTEPAEMEPAEIEPEEMEPEATEPEERRAVPDYKWAKDIPGGPVSNIISGISLNDRVLLINTLFKEDPARFQHTINAFNGMECFADACDYVQENFPDWNLSSDIVYRLMMAVRRKLK